MEHDPNHAQGLPPAEDASKAETLTRKQASRRTLLRAGAGAAPVLLALRSGPVGATGQSCVVASSFVSVTTFKSRNASATSLQCTTYNYDHWRSCEVAPRRAPLPACGAHHCAWKVQRSGRCAPDSARLPLRPVLRCSCTDVR